MTADEFDRWLDHAIHAYAEIDSLMRKDNDQGTDRANQWSTAFADVPVEHATECIDSMLRGDTEIPEYGWSRLPSMVRSFSRQRVNTDLSARDREDSARVSYRCRVCHDQTSGFVIVWNPFFVRDNVDEINELDGDDVLGIYSHWRRWQKKHENRHRGGMTFTTLCICTGGIAERKRQELALRRTPESLKRHSFPPTAITYDVDKFGIAVHKKPSEIQEWLKTHRPVELLPNYEKSFDEWS